MPWVARIIPILVRVIGRGGRIGAKRGVGDIGKNLPKVVDKARRADGWKSSALSKFSNSVGLIASAMTIAMAFDWRGLKGNAADAAKDRCDKAAQECKKQDEHSADGAQSVGECGKKVDEVLEDCEKQAEDMAEQTDGILSQCEALVDDPECGAAAAKVAQQVCNSLVDSTSQLYGARNACIEQCLEQAACDTEAAVVNVPPQPPAIAASSGATSAACAGMTEAVSASGAIAGGIAVGTNVDIGLEVGVAAGLSAGVAIGAVGAASIAGSVATALLNLEMCTEIEEPVCEPEPEPEPEPEECKPEPEPQNAPEPPPPAEKLKHLGIDLPQEPQPQPDAQPQPEAQPQAAPVQESASASPEAPEPQKPQELVGTVNSPTAGEW